MKDLLLVVRQSELAIIRTDGIPCIFSADKFNISVSTRVSSFSVVTYFGEFYPMEQGLQIFFGGIFPQTTHKDDAIAIAH